MIWLTWKRHSVAWVLGTLALLILAGMFIADAYSISIALQAHQFKACSLFESPSFYNPSSCGLRVLGSTEQWRSIAPLLQFLPLFIAIFVGAPLLAREYEKRAHIFTWTQSISRKRWFMITLGSPVVYTMLIIGMFAVVTTWWGDTQDWVVNPWRTFLIRGPVFVALTLFCLLFGVMVGAFVRRVLRSMIVTLLVVAIGFIALTQSYQFVIPAERDVIRGISFQTESTILDNHRRDMIMFWEYRDQNGQLITNLNSYCGLPKENELQVYTTTMTACFKEKPVTFTMEYYSFEKSFWPLQWVLSVICAVLSAICAVVTYWQVQRRVL